MNTYTTSQSYLHDRISGVYTTAALHNCHLASPAKIKPANLNLEPQHNSENDELSSARSTGSWISDFQQESEVQRSENHQFDRMEHTTKQQVQYKELIRTTMMAIYLRSKLELEKNFKSKLLLLIVVASQFILVAFYNLDLLSTNTAYQIGLCVALISFFTLYFDCSSLPIKSLEEEYVLGPNSSRLLAESRNRAEFLYQQMLTRISESRMELNHISQLINQISQHTSLIENSRENDDNSLYEHPILNQSFSGQLTESQGLSKEEIETLMPVHIFKNKDSALKIISSEDNRICCTICLEDLISGQVIRTSPCAHTFHKSCIDDWLTIKKSCPNCKHEPMT
mmetsp:Transcript_1646/g.1756  ORF Transcript_1646/g.1756 Transcript_1646/m.1756 type:complete len:340 (+) Transcript_1646:82-1101(+)